MEEEDIPWIAAMGRRPVEPSGSVGVGVCSSDPDGSDICFNSFAV